MGLTNCQQLQNIAGYSDETAAQFKVHATNLSCHQNTAPSRFSAVFPRPWNAFYLLIMRHESKNRRYNSMGQLPFTELYSSRVGGTSNLSQEVLLVHPLLSWNPLNLTLPPASLQGMGLILVCLTSSM